MQDIKKYSQSLDALLRENFKNVDLATLIKTFLHVIQRGGNQELDYTREAGQSFNPRPARIAYILINNCKIKNRDLIQASFLACIDNRENKISAQALDILDLELNDNYTNLSKVLSLALLLDRIRHIHLSKKFSDTEFRKNFYKKIKAVLEISSNTSNELTILINHWLKRNENY